MNVKEQYLDSEQTSKPLLVTYMLHFLILTRPEGEGQVSIVRL